MDFKNFSWKMFERTGDINIYLALKDGYNIDDSLVNHTEDMDSGLIFANELREESKV